MATRRKAAPTVAAVPATTKRKPGPKTFEPTSRLADASVGVLTPVKPAIDLDMPLGTALNALANASGMIESGPVPSAAFYFGLGDTVKISASREEGMVRARAQYISGNVSYYVAWVSARGEFREGWIDQDLLSAA